MARTIEFDRNEVLENAMNTFWNNGYSMTSIPNLVDSTKLNPGSIYSAFKSKEGLFLETLEFYGLNSVSQLKQYFDDSSSPLSAIEAFLKGIVDKCKSTDKRGCLIVNSILEMASHNDAVQAKANLQLQAVEDELVKGLQQAQAMGELSADKNPADLAKFLMVNIWGLRVMAKTNPDAQSADIVLKQILEALHH
ncbi:TetR/AcrR family transcriptional regulator [Cocleimonas flava]|uniref:TetR family transcriptional regulator n=1 Tax=Cocleimonas flava TaxID=634765 RepID=A0A4R1F483_9GAMM|nr:TetR/AcrR family transcriptional regulator [Cocleimonas flava]TCJ85231.1 TetR family transcriptional regulator [Cocleimonas flava]